MSKIPTANDPLDFTVYLGAILPVGNRTMTINADARKIISDHYEYKACIANKNDAPVETNIFLNDNFNHLSAVVFSRMNCVHFVNWNEPALGLKKDFNDFLLVHNPKAKNPLPLGLLTVSREMVVNKTEATINVKEL